MEHEEVLFHLQDLKEWDELDLIDALRLTSEELVEMFEERAIEFIKENW